MGYGPGYLLKIARVRSTYTNHTESHKLLNREGSVRGFPASWKLAISLTTNLQRRRNKCLSCGNLFLCVKRQFVCIWRARPAHCYLGFLYAHYFSQTFHLAWIFCANPPFWFVDEESRTCAGQQRRPGHELLIKCSAHFAREGRSMGRRFTDGGTKNVAPRRSNFRKGTNKTNQVRFLTVGLDECL